MENLEKIIKNLENDEKFKKIYIVSLEKGWSDSFFIRVKRRETSIGDKLVYDPDVSGIDNYIVDYCFEIYYRKGYVTDTLSTYTNYHYSDDDNYKYRRIQFALDKIEVHYQTILMGEVDVNAIKNYITNTDWNIRNIHRYETTIIPSNGFICEKCKCQISKSAY
jgi:hypothetical protein